MREQDGPWLGSSLGFSLIETIVVTALTLSIMAVIFTLVEPARDSFAVQSEAIDMQQRLRVVAGTLYNDLVMAGGGPYQGLNKGPLGYYFAPILPFRRGTDRDDPAGVFKTDTITLMYVPSTVAQTTVAAVGLGAGSADVTIRNGPGCPLTDAACGFRTGMNGLLYDASGMHDPITITNVESNILSVLGAGGSVRYAAYLPATTAIVEIINNVYYLKRDAATESYQLMFANGGAGADRPVADHVVGLTFTYYGDPQPPMLNGKPLTDPIGPWTTYGPAPPQRGREIPTGGYPAGENCAFVVDPTSDMPLPRLGILGATAPSTLVELTDGQVTDGPWCPDATDANRWDADLLRIRRIGVTIRVQAAVARLRGPASALFTNGGTSKSGTRWLPDHEISFEVTPRNLMLGGP